MKLKYKVGDIVRVKDLTGLQGYPEETKKFLTNKNFTVQQVTETEFGLRHLNYIVFIDIEPREGIVIEPLIKIGYGVNPLIPKVTNILVRINTGYQWRLVVFNDLVVCKSTGEVRFMDISGATFLEAIPLSREGNREYLYTNTNLEYSLKNIFHYANPLF